MSFEIVRIFLFHLMFYGGGGGVGSIHKTTSSDTGKANKLATWPGSCKLSIYSVQGCAIGIVTVVTVVIGSGLEVPPMTFF